MEGSDHHEVEAKVVAVDPSIEPIHSVVVGDNRNKFGRNLGILAIALLLLFFAVSSYVQSAKNGALLERAAKDRSQLISEVTGLTADIKRRQALIDALEQAIKQQNRILRRAGLHGIQIPDPDPGTNAPTSRPPTSSSPKPSSSSGNGPKPKPKPSPTHAKKPNPKPKPKPSPTKPLKTVKKRLCKLTGICL